MTDWSPEDEEREREEDERNTGCFLQSLGCAGEGCLTAAIPCVVAFVWFLS